MKLCWSGTNEQMFLVHFANDSSLTSSRESSAAQSVYTPHHSLLLFCFISFTFSFFVVVVGASLDRVTIVIIGRTWGLELPFLVGVFFVVVFIRNYFSMFLLLLGETKTEFISRALMVDVVLMSRSVNSDAIKLGGD